MFVYVVLESEKSEKRDMIELVHRILRDHVIFDLSFRLWRFSVLRFPSI